MTVPPRTTHRAFSLVEITLSIGIVAFVLLAVFGLFTVSMRSSRESSEDLALALASETVRSDLDARDFRTVTMDAKFQDQSPDYYFNQSGRSVAAADADRLYECEVQVIDPPAAQYSAPASGLGSLKIARLVFKWPPNIAKPQTRVVVTSLANYE